MANVSRAASVALGVLLFCGLLLVVSESSADQPSKTPLPTFAIEQRTEKPLLVPERPYENFTLNYCNVIRTKPNRWHLWYATYDQSYRNDTDGFLCYARSEDGIRWERPDLGLVEYGGNKRNNIVLSGKPIGGVSGATIFLDEKADENERFRMVYSKLRGSEWHVFGGTSADGIHWKLLEKPLLKKNSDTQTVCFRDGDVYRMYVRTWSGGLYRGKRAVGYCESRTFGEFSNPVEILAPDKEDPADFQFYTPSATKLKDNLYVLFPAGYSTRQDVLRAHIAFSRDGKKIERAGRGPVIDLGKEFDSHGIYVAPGAIPGERPGTYWFYYLGVNYPHNGCTPAKVKNGGGIGRFSLVLNE